MRTEAKRALLVEPEFLHAELAASTLAAAGFEVAQHTDACDAHLWILEQQERFDIAVVTFPGQKEKQSDAARLLEHLRELSMPRVIVSDLDRGELGTAFPLRDGEGYLEKPCVDERFLEVVAEVLIER